MNRLKDKVAVITGAALGIGAATARRLGEEGAAVALLDLHGAEGEALAARLDAAGIKARFWPCDVAKEAEVKRVFGEVENHFGRIDVLVNNAGVSGANKPTHELTEEEWDFVQAINVKGVFFCTKYAVPAMKRAGGGSIINLSSIYGLVGAPDTPPYHASKGAVRLMSKTDAMIYAPDKIRVNSVHPGFIWTPMVEAHLKSAGELEEGKAATAALHPLGHMGEPDDIAWGAVYLASDEAKFVTGSELVIDGGYTAR
ncbi:MAG: glucose 1-dehydrogenase [Hyphomonadaceae bacterium]|nr:glucose 1-dehydrogenase [Hyphomonadaceae bacterium]GIK50084.1 MAG: 2,5-dichloro-2,5-cyclohexadiene-1,4-diol dehydrogenase [Alphaproteobacteria bacterium]